VCGGAGYRRDARDGRPGRSPRVRGSRRPLPQRLHVHGSIPACAGEPAALMGGVSCAGVDPRVCGGARSATEVNAPSRGRSPRVRGSLDTGLSIVDALGSIPACAGEPASAGASARPEGVDPRVCGGAIFSASGGDQSPGRSPRVRGSRQSRSPSPVLDGSIPACAGEPRPLADP